MTQEIIVLTHTRRFSTEIFT